MRKAVKIIAFQIGVNVLGFPEFHVHRVTDLFAVHSKYFKAFSKN